MYVLHSNDMVHTVQNIMYVHNNYVGSRNMIHIIEVIYIKTEKYDIRVQIRNT
jgi:hypothetical protein